MKHDELRSIAHNMADSLASGIGLLVGVYEIDIFGEAKNSKEGFITVDFLKGIISEGQASTSLTHAVGLYRDKLDDFCKKHGALVASFREFTARYSCDACERYVLVTIEDDQGHRSIDAYVGTPLRRIKTLDGLGRIRTKRD